MQKNFIPFKDTQRFSELINAYLDRSEVLEPFYGRYPLLSHFEAQLKEKKASYPNAHRKVLVEVLQEQYKTLFPSAAIQKNIKLLENETTFTITTGHQLSLMTGPLYFIYKIISTLNLCKQLKKKYPKADFIPIYWMASEDHDFEEISSFRFNDKGIRWPGEAAGAVGEMTLEELLPALDVFETHLDHSDHAKQLKALIAKSYRSAHNLSDATLKLVHELFAEQGLIILEPQKRALKRLFMPYIKKELLESTSFSSVSEQTERLINAFETHYTPQVNPRTINLFYLTPQGRHRIEKKGAHFHLHGSDQIFSTTALLSQLEEQPELFSPNVILRPLYQECILPNLCYIGGGGELAYWFQLKTTFQEFEIPFPMLLLRNSALLYSKKIGKKIKNLNLTTADLFLTRNALLNKKIRQISNIDLDLTDLKEQLKKQFDQLSELVTQTDASFKGAVDAQQAKQIKGLKNLEKRLLKAQKRVLKDEVQRLVLLHEKLFPNDHLQERTLNFTGFYLEIGPDFIAHLTDALDPLNPEFVLLEY
ncbi:MAG: bacillithiol biosynthesis cysteine-adding enzyme BshC [Flavobacteriaceae bacterium]